MPKFSKIINYYFVGIIIIIIIIINYDVATALIIEHTIV
jgi:hypothetical protein